MTDISQCEIHITLTDTKYVGPLLTERHALIRCLNLTAVFEQYHMKARMDGKDVELALWDTAYVPPFIPHIFEL